MAHTPFVAVYHVVNLNALADALMQDSLDRKAMARYEHELMLKVALPAVVPWSMWTLTFNPLSAKLQESARLLTWMAGLYKGDTVAQTAQEFLKALTSGLRLYLSGDQTTENDQSGREGESDDP